MVPGASYVMRFEEIGAADDEEAAWIEPAPEVHPPSPPDMPLGEVPGVAVPPPSAETLAHLGLSWTVPEPMEPSEDAGVVLGPVGGDEVALPVGAHPVAPPTEPT